MLMDFIEWLISEADKRGWSSNRLARECGVSHTAMAKLISGKQRITFDMSYKIALAFKMPPEKVFRLAGLMPRIHPDRQVIEGIVDMLNALPKNEVAEIAEFTEFKYKKIMTKNI